MRVAFDDEPKNKRKLKGKSLAYPEVNNGFWISEKSQSKGVSKIWTNGMNFVILNLSNFVFAS